MSIKSSLGIYGAICLANVGNGVVLYVSDDDFADIGVGGRLNDPNDVVCVFEIEIRRPDADDGLLERF